MKKLKIYTTIYVLLIYEQYFVAGIVFNKLIAQKNTIVKTPLRSMKRTFSLLHKCSRYSHKEWMKCRLKSWQSVLAIQVNKPFKELWVRVCFQQP